MIWHFQTCRHVSSLLMPHLFHNNVESSWILPSAKMSSRWHLHGSGFRDNGTLRATSKVQSYVLDDGSLRSCSQKFFLKKIKDEVTSNWAIVHRETKCPHALKHTEIGNPCALSPPSPHTLEQHQCYRANSAKTWATWNCTKDRETTETTCCAVNPTNPTLH